MVLFEKKITKNVIKRLALFSKHIPRSEVYSIMKHMKFMLHRIMQMISNNDKSRYFGVLSRHDDDGPSMMDHQ